METAKVWRYYVGAIKILVPEGTAVVRKGDTTFGFEGYLGVFDASEVPSLLRTGYLRRAPK